MKFKLTEEEYYAFLSAILIRIDDYKSRLEYFYNKNIESDTVEIIESLEQSIEILNSAYKKLIKLDYKQSTK